MTAESLLSFHRLPVSLLSFHRILQVLAWAPLSQVASCAAPPSVCSSSSSWVSGPWEISTEAHFPPATCISMTVGVLMRSHLTNSAVTFAAPNLGSTSSPFQWCFHSSSPPKTSKFSLVQNTFPHPLESWCHLMFTTGGEVSTSVPSPEEIYRD